MLSQGNKSIACSSLDRQADIPGKMSRIIDSWLKKTSQAWQSSPVVMKDPFSPSLQLPTPSTSLGTLIWLDFAATSNKTQRELHVANKEVSFAFIGGIDEL